MADIVNILPDAVANQIAAGEVVQRPASIVKELLENAIDAGSTQITLLVKEAGKALIQVSDNGSGMSETDARLCFERHATSKIKNSEDLFRIATKGFRGEALSSIAAVAKVNLKTKRPQDTNGTQLFVENSEVISQEPCSCPDGSIFTVKNLFYNVPARRKFLKTDVAETRHITDEFLRIALAHPEISLVFQLNGNTIYHLEKGNFPERILALFGKSYQDRIVPVDEQDTEIVHISGYIIKPEHARKTRGEQYFMVNRRFIKSPYLHHAIAEAYEDMMPKDSHPGYFLHLTVDPEKIDINIHPTKTEIKFEEDRHIYAILKSAVRNALGKHHVTPSLNFEQEPAFAFSPLKSIDQIKLPSTGADPSYNPFKTENGGYAPKHDTFVANRQLDEFRKEEHQLFAQQDETLEFAFFQLQNRYLVMQSKQGLFVIDQHRAHERVLYEKYLAAWESKAPSSQMELFPHTLEFPAADFIVLEGMMEQLVGMGFDMEKFGQNTLVVRGVPPDAVGRDIPRLLESILEDFRNTSSSSRTERTETLARILASRTAVRAGMILNKAEARQLLVELFACQLPGMAPNGKPVIFQLSTDELDQKFLKA